MIGPRERQEEREMDFNEIELRHIGAGIEDEALIDEVNAEIRRIITFLLKPRREEKGTVAVKITIERKGDAILASGKVRSILPARIRKGAMAVVDHDGRAMVAEAVQTNLFGADVVNMAKKGAKE